MKLPSNMTILERKPRPGALRALTLQAPIVISIYFLLTISLLDQT